MTVLVYSCPEENIGASSTLNGDVPFCSSGGAWIEQPSLLSTQIEASSFSDLLSATVLAFVVAGSIRMVLNVIRGRR